MTGAQRRLIAWMLERHYIYLRRKAGDPPPWTDDLIMQRYRFCNVFRELDRVTIHQRTTWTDPHDVNFKPSWPQMYRLAGDMIFACGVYRIIGTPAFADAFGWPVPWNAARAIRTIERLRRQRISVFTSAYMISNLRSSEPKSRVVCRTMLTSFWKRRDEIAETVLEYGTLQYAHEIIMTVPGFGPFMAYEVVSDLANTWVLRGARDRFSWANAGPGARRGLNRLHGRPLTQPLAQEQGCEEMRELLEAITPWWPKDWPILTMREIEHSLCELDKMERAKERIEAGLPVGLERLRPKGPLP